MMAAIWEWTRRERGAQPLKNGNPINELPPPGTALMVHCNITTRSAGADPIYRLRQSIDRGRNS
jgi:hypothetical protein